MATYYRWRKSSVAESYQAVALQTKNFYLNQHGVGADVWTGSLTSISEDGSFLGTGVEYQSYQTVRYPNYYLSSRSDRLATIQRGRSNTAPYLMYVTYSGEYGQEDENEVSGTMYGTEVVTSKGNFIEYIYSESADAYPTDGVSGNYWYSDRTAITVSPPSSISVSPHPPKGGSNVSVSWGAASSGGGAISNYELSKRLDGGGWTVVGTYGSSTRTASVSVPRGTETIAFRVRAKDNHGFWSNSVSYTHLTLPTKRIV